MEQFEYVMVLVSIMIGFDHLDALSAWSTPAVQSKSNG